MFWNKSLPFPWVNLGAGLGLLIAGSTAQALMNCTGSCATPLKSVTDESTEASGENGVLSVVMDADLPASNLNLPKKNVELLMNTYDFYLDAKRRDAKGGF